MAPAEFVQLVDEGAFTGQTGVINKDMRDDESWCFVGYILVF